MITFTTGDILKASTDAIVNTVNCEGYMGKGIAYQFKLKFPKNNELYVKACKKGEFKIGSILSCFEGGKTIINFPTKDEWRKNSKYEYIDTGMNTLIKIIPDLNIESIAFPPLGCGNGGLEWMKVKEILLQYLEPLKNNYEIVIYEPSGVINDNEVKKAPKLNASHLILMKIKLELTKFNKTRLQKTGYLLNYFAEEDYFKFEAYNFGPYANSISILSREIKEFQEYYNFDTKRAVEWASNTMISESVIAKLRKYESSIEKATSFVNSIKTDKELELITTILFLISNNSPIDFPTLKEKFKSWSEHKAESFSDNEIEEGVNSLLKENLLKRSLMGLEASSTSIVINS